MPDVKYLFFHTAAADLDNVDAAEIDRWHKAKGWKGIGYHYVIIDDRHDTKEDGQIEKGRPESQNGAQVLGVNHISLGICCVGHGDKRDFTPAQKKSLVALLAKLARKSDVPVKRILGHREVNDLIEQGKVSAEFRTTKTCPGTQVDTDQIRALVKKAIAGHPAEEIEIVTTEDGAGAAVKEAITTLQEHQSVFGNALPEWRDFLFHGEIRGILGRERDA